MNVKDAISGTTTEAQRRLTVLEQERDRLIATLDRDESGELTRRARDTLDAWDERHAVEYAVLLGDGGRL